MRIAIEQLPLDATDGWGVYRGVPSGATSALSILNMLFGCLTPMRVTGCSMVRALLSLSVALSVISQLVAHPQVYCSTAAVVTWKQPVK